MSKTPDNGPGDRYQFDDCYGVEVGAPVFTVPTRVVEACMSPSDDNDTAIVAAGSYEINRVTLETPVTVVIDHGSKTLNCQYITRQGRCEQFNIVAIARGNVRVHVCKFLDDPDGIPTIHTPNAAREVLVQVGPVRERR